MLLDIVILLIGFVIIIKSSDVLVDAASSLALKLGVPKMLIALTIVSFGTCAPEVAISFRSVANGDGVMAFANVIGSSIVNVFLIIGLASFIRPIKVRHATVKKELPLLFIVTTVFSILMLDAAFNPLTPNTFSRSDSLILMLLFCMFILYLVGMLFKRNKNNKEESDKGKFSIVVSCLLLLVTIILIIYSSEMIIDSAKSIATALNISEKAITMTAIVIGTSLPEMIMTVTSARKGEFDMAIGNIIGTNIFNICIVLGLPILIFGNIVLEGFGFIDILAVFLSSFLLFVFARSEREVSKKEGTIMLIVFVLYYVYMLFF
ncbi:MAG TPA: calcium/sodium antiporter [Candidatus Onthousia faecipullorum]|mgnify:CR=1 FL=1|uniref:Calcium/sodium antiporter n=1 Tax=Candidatus Onthousia faecipullorum TaxID=2840887 RepID=A0A9D1KB87_9FIRM|nr:calcium/sodium antiporter [Candidatus Onthousia faecipullorum]